MRSRFLHVLSGMVLASVAVLATGCNHDTLSGGSQNLTMTYTPSPSGAGRFNCEATAVTPPCTASFNVIQIKVLPADPEERKLYQSPSGPGGLLFLFSAFSANLTLTAAVPISQIPLSTGTYNVTSIQFTPPELVDQNLAPPPYASCMEGVSTINTSSPAAFLFKDTVDDLSRLTFTVQPGQTSLSLTVDVPGLIADYEAAFAPGCVPCQNCSQDPRSTLTTFDAAAFRANVLANISIK